MKSLLTLLIFSVALFSKEYSVDLYDHSGRGHWQMVGISGFPEQNFQQTHTATDSSGAISGSTRVGFFPREDIDNAGTDENTAFLTILDPSITSVTIEIDNENNVSYYDGKETKYAQFMNVGGNGSQLKLEFMRSFFGKSFSLKVVSASGTFKYSAVFKDANSKDPYYPRYIDENTVAVPDINLSLERKVEDVFLKTNGTRFTGTDDFKVFGYSPSAGWQYWSNQNTELQNGDFILESGKGYWMKFTEGNPLDSHKVAKGMLDDEGFQLTSSTLEHLSSEYNRTGKLEEGWNLISLPDSKFRDVATGFIVTYNANGDDANISLTIGEYNDVNLSLVNVAAATESFQIARQLNKLIATTPIADSLVAIPVSGGTLAGKNIMFLSDKIISGVDENYSNSHDGLSKLYDLQETERFADTDHTTDYNTSYGTHIVFIQPEHNLTVSVNSENVDINNTRGLMDGLPSEVKAFPIDSDLDGNSTTFAKTLAGSVASTLYSDLIMLTSSEEIKVKDTNTYREYLLDLSNIYSDWNSSTAYGTAFRFTIVEGDRTTPVDFTEMLLVDKNTTTIAEIETNLTREINNSSATLSAITDIDANGKGTITLISTNSGKTKLRLYDDGLASSAGLSDKIPLIFKPSYNSSSTVSTVYKVGDVIDTLTSNLSPTKTPMRIGISSDGRTAINPLAIFNGAGYKAGHILTAENTLLAEKDQITWRKLNLNVKDEDIFNEDDALDLFYTDKDKAYWVYLVEKDGNEGEIALVDESIDIQFNFEHYYDINESTSASIFVNSPISVSIDPSLVPDTVLDRLFAYIRVNGTVIPLEKTVDTFSVNINGFDIGNVIEDNITLTISDGRGLVKEFSSDEIESFALDLRKPKTPSISILHGVESGNENNFIVVSLDENSSASNFRIYKDPLSNTDSSKAYDGNFTAGEDTVTIPLGELIDSFGETITLADGIGELFALTKTDEKIENSVVSDIDRHKFVSLYSGSAELTAQADEDKIATIYDVDGVATENSQNNGVSLKSFELGGSLFYEEIADEELDTKTLPIYMLIGMDGKDANFEVAFTNAYIGKTFYVLFNNHLYQGKFDTTHTDNSDSYKLDVDAVQVY
jgi:hypothetical protein